MLVLTRKVNERIEIGDGIVLTLLRIKGQQARIGIEAPREMRIRRAELPKLPNAADAAAKEATASL